MPEFLLRPWPWYVAGPLIGLLVPLLLLIGNRHFGVSSNLRHFCAATLPRRTGYLDYDWKRGGLWNLAFAAGIVLGGFLSVTFLGAADSPGVAVATQMDLARLGITDTRGAVPRQLFDWGQLLTLPGLVLLVVGGFLVGFGTAYAGGCTSGHGVYGLADLQAASLVAVAGFFAGGLIATHLLLPRLLGGG
jgi:uncharacterized membrane protein YedE/YeeE